MAHPAVFVAIVTAIAGVLTAIFSYFGTLAKSRASTAATNNKTEIEKLKIAMQEQLENRKLDAQSLNIFQSNLLAQIKNLQEEINLLRGRNQELEKAASEREGRIRELEDEVENLRRQMLRNNLHVLPGNPSPPKNPA